MGEKIEELGFLDIAGEKYQVDANLGLPGRGGRDIHIQNNRLRFQMYENDFLNFLAKVVSANAKIKRMKGLR